MIIGPLTNQKKTQFIRLWDGVLPRVLHPTGPALRFAQPSAASQSLDTQRILAIEMKIGHGPMITYGLLGLAYQAAISDQLAISILASADKEDAFEDAIAPPGDRVYWYYPRAFALATQKAILAFNRLPPGTIEFNCAAVADAGSNEVVFAHLSRILLTALRDRLDCESIAEMAFSCRFSETASLFS